MAKRMKVAKDKSGHLTAAGRRAPKSDATDAVGEAAAPAKVDAKTKRKFGVGASALHDHPRSAR